MRPDADLSMRGLPRLVAELLERFDLRAVTLVANDWGGAHLLVSERGGERVARLVITSCEAFDNYPPGLPGRAVWLAAKVPGGLNAMCGSISCPLWAGSSSLGSTLPTLQASTRTGLLPDSLRLVSSSSM